MEIISSIFSDYNGMKLEINYRKKNYGKTHVCRLNIILLNNQWLKEEIKQEIKNYLEGKKTHNFVKFIGCSKSSSKREVHSHIGIPQEARKFPNKQSNFIPKEILKSTRSKINRR